MARFEISQTTAAAYVDKPAALVFAKVEQIGFEAAAELWSESMNSEAISRLYREHRQTLDAATGKIMPRAREIVAVTKEFGSVVRAAKQLRCSQDTVYKAHRQLGVQWPKLTVQQKAQATKEGMAARRRARGKPVQMPLFETLETRLVEKTAASTSAPRRLARAVLPSLFW